MTGGERGLCWMLRSWCRTYHLYYYRYVELKYTALEALTKPPVSLRTSVYFCDSSLKWYRVRDDSELPQVCCAHAYHTSVVNHFLHCLFPNYFFQRTSVHHFKTDQQNGKRKHTNSERPRKRTSLENIYWPHSRRPVSLVMFTCFLTLSLSCPANELSARNVKDAWG
jgi:hypothetical protein